MDKEKIHNICNDSVMTKHRSSSQTLRLHRTRRSGRKFPRNSNSLFIQQSKGFLMNIQTLRMFVLNFWRTIMFCFNDFTAPMGSFLFTRVRERDLTVVLSHRGCTLGSVLPPRTIKSMLQSVKRRFNVRREVFLSPSSPFIRLLLCNCL